MMVLPRGATTLPPPAMRTSPAGRARNVVAVVGGGGEVSGEEGGVRVWKEMVGVRFGDDDCRGGVRLVALLEEEGCRDATFTVS